MIGDTAIVQESRPRPQYKKRLDNQSQDGFLADKLASGYCYTTFHDGRLRICTRVSYSSTVG